MYWIQTSGCLVVYTPAKRMCSGVYWNQPVCSSVYVSVRVAVCVQNTCFCQSASGGIKSHVVTALVNHVLNTGSCNAQY